MPEPRFDQIGHPVSKVRIVKDCTLLVCMYVIPGGTQPNLAKSPWDEVAQMATLRIIIARMNTHTHTHIHQGDTFTCFKG